MTHYTVQCGYASHRHRHGRSQNLRRRHPRPGRHRTCARRLIAAGHSSIANRPPCTAPSRCLHPTGCGLPGRVSGSGLSKIQPQEDRPMKLFTEKQRTTLLANGAEIDVDHVPVVKLFNPCGAGTWLLSELDPEYPDECAFGLADLGFGTPELGSVGLSELSAYRGPVRPRYRARYSLYGKICAFRLRRGRACCRAYRRIRTRTRGHRPKPFRTCRRGRTCKPAITGTSHGPPAWREPFASIRRFPVLAVATAADDATGDHRHLRHGGLRIRSDCRKPVARYPDRSLERFGREPARLGQSMRHRAYGH